MKTWIAAALIAIALFAAPVTTSAQPYAILAAGAAANNVTCTPSSRVTCENTDVAFKVLGGYGVAPWIAIEAVYLDFGAARRSGLISEDSFGTAAFGGGAALRANLASWTLTARGGAASVASQIAVMFKSTNSPSPSTTTTHTLMPYGGAELGYHFSQHVGLAAAVDMTRSKWIRSDGVTLEWNAFALTAGLTIGR